MEIIKVGIYHQDRAFASALAVGLARESRAIQFVLMDRAEMDENLAMILSSLENEDKRNIQMVQSREQENLSSPPYRLFQYKESRSLIDDLLFIYFKMTDRVLEYRGSCKCSLMTFVSDGGGSGTTMTSIAAAKTLYRIYGSRILYLNLCPIDDSKKYLKPDVGAGLLKLLYYLDTEKDFPLEAFITRTEELDYINTGVMNSYCSDMKAPLMNRLIKKAEALGQYDYLLVDIGGNLSRESKRILENSDLVALVHNSASEEPGAYFESISGEILKKAEGARALYIENFGGDDWHEETDERLWISRDAGAVQMDQEEGILKIDLSRNYGIEIAAIAKKIVEDI